MRYQPNRWIRRAARIVGVLATAVLTANASGSAFAHEGHAALPTTGATVDGDQVLVSDGARKGLGLKTATVTLQDLSRVLGVRANVELPWDGQATATTLVSGRVQTILVKPGETVTAGQELARIESLEVETLQLTMLRAAEQLALAERLVEQRRPLAERGAIPGKSLLEAETTLRQRQVQLAIAERKLMALGLSKKTLQQVQRTGEPISSISVTSPLGGVVMHADVRVGQFVDTEQHLFNIVDRSRVLVVGEVLETDIWQVEPGNTVEVTLAARPGKTFAGTIERLRLHVRPNQRTLGVVVPVDNPEMLLRPGMSGRMQITVSQSQEAIVCPTAALIDTPSRTFVLLRRGEGKYQRREVKIGLRTPEQVEILDGLFPGDRVIVTGTKLLASMFHTDRKPTAPSVASPRSRIAVNRASSERPERPFAIPVAYAVVTLPTDRKVFATPAIAGRIVHIHVQPGELVEAGQILAELDSQALRNLQLELLETQETLRWTIEVIERVEPLARTGAYPKSQLWEYQMRQKTLEHQLQNVERKLLIVGLSSEQIEALRHADPTRSDRDVAFVTVPVRAPAAGRVADFDVGPGQVVHANDALFEIQDRSRVWIEGYVFEQHAAGVAVGQAAEIQVPAYPELQLTGKVVRSAPTLQSSARVLPVWIEIENPGDKLREGMLARVEILPQSAGRHVVLRPDNSASE